MGWSFPIGRLFGSELRVHATFLLLIGWIAIATWMAEGPAAAAENVAFILALFACVVAHEFGHALMARRYGIATPDITLLPIGGLARLERMPEDPRQEIAVALAGPAVSVLIWAVLALAAGPGLGALAEIERTGAGFLARLAGVNLFLALFNMIPAFPMDGGRVLRAALATRLPRARATRIAAMAGQVLAFLFGVAGFASGNVMLMLIAVFVWFAATAENADVAMREATRGLLARDAAITVYEPLSPDDTLDAAAHALIRTTQHEFPVIGPDGRLEGFLTRQALARALASGARGDPVSGAMLREVPAVALDARLDRVLAALQTAPAVAVTDAAGRFIGYVTPDNLGELMMLRGRG